MIQNFRPENSFLKRTYIKDALLSLIMINRMIPHVHYNRSSELKLQPLKPIRINFPPHPAPLAGL